MTGSPLSLPVAAGRAQPGPAAGLVERVTTRTHRHETKHFIKSECYRELNHLRRLSRMRRVVVASAEAAAGSIQRQGARVAPIMVTCTYRPGVEWRKEHISGLLHVMRQYAHRRGVRLRYQWVLELTQRGVPHYHVLLWTPAKFRFPRPDSAGWWPHGSTRIELARRPVGYMVKYASKGMDPEIAGEIPTGARIFGVGNAAGAERHEVGRARLPAWLQEVTAFEQRPRRVVGVGWVCPDTGKVYQSPFRFDLVRGEGGRYVVVFWNTGANDDGN